MPNFVRLLRSIGDAVVKNGMRAIANVVPFGDVAFDIARAAFKDYCDNSEEANLRGDIEEIARVSITDIHREAEKAAALAPRLSPT